MARIIISTETTIIRTRIPGNRFVDGEERHFDTKISFRSDNYNHGTAWRNGTQLFDGLASMAYDAYRAEINRILNIDNSKLVPGTIVEVIKS